MSLRRSARTSTAAQAVQHDGGKAEAAVAKTKKRQRRSKVTEDIAATAIAQDGVEDAAADMAPPATPVNKRRKVAVKLPPVTPTPAAVGMMTSSSVLRPTYSTGDIDDATPPPEIKDGMSDHSHAAIVTPGGTQLPRSYSNFEGPSPTKPVPSTSGETLLEKACAGLIAADPSLKPLIEAHHCRVFAPEGLTEEIDPFRSLSSGIMAQQVSGAAAKSIKNKFISLFPAEKCPTGFPSPELVAATPLHRLREAGLSQRKAEYISGLAGLFASGELTFQFLQTASDDEVMAKLVAVRGLGAWSVEMFMCFALKRMDVLSTGDLGVQRGMAAYVGRDVKKLKASGKGVKWKYMSEKEMVETAERFRPWRSLFMWYMWRIETPVDLAAIEEN